MKVRVYAINTVEIQVAALKTFNNSLTLFLLWLYGAAKPKRFEMVLPVIQLVIKQLSKYNLYHGKCLIQKRYEIESACFPIWAPPVVKNKLEKK